MNLNGNNLQKAKVVNQLVGPQQRQASPEKPNMKWFSNTKFSGNFQTHDAFLRFVRNKTKARVYLEIGVHHGQTLIMQETTVRLAIGVDPAYDIPEPQPASIALFKKTSDSFFADEDYSRLTRRKVDLTFVDGMHWAEFALRDVLNAERLSTSKSIILLHDIIPTTAAEASREQGPGCWMGDVYKAVLALRTYRPDLDIICLEDIPPSGMAVIRNLNPKASGIDLQKAEAFMQAITFENDFESQMRPLLRKFDPKMF